MPAPAAPIADQQAESVARARKSPGRRGEKADRTCPYWLLPQSLLVAIFGLGLIMVPEDSSPQTEAPLLLRVDPNTAPPGVLASLPRLGPTRVSALVEAREERAFHSPEDLQHRVKGIGPVTLHLIRPHLRFEP